MTPGRPTNSSLILRVSPCCAVPPALMAHQFKGMLASKFDIQLNKTSRNSVLLQTNINNTRSDIAYLIKVLADISRGTGSEALEGPRGEGGV